MFKSTFLQPKPSSRQIVTPRLKMISAALVVAGSLTGLVVGAYALAAGDKDATGDGKSALAASMDLVRSILPPEAYEAMLDQMYQQMSISMQQAGGGAALPASKQKDLKAAVIECLPYDDLLSWTAGVYSQHFTKKEIDDVAGFYRTPTGKKMARLMPVLTGEVGAKIGPLLMTRLPAAMKKHGLQ
jgi:uncharacterized protein